MAWALPEDAVAGDAGWRGKRKNMSADIRTFIVTGVSLAEEKIYQFGAICLQPLPRLTPEGTVPNAFLPSRHRVFQKIVSFSGPNIPYLWDVWREPGISLPWRLRYAHLLFGRLRPGLFEWQWQSEHASPD